MSKEFTRASILLISIILLMEVVLVGCGSQSGLASDQVLKLNIATEPPSLDPGTAQDSTSFTVLSGLYDGLTRLDASGEPQPAIAKKWEVSNDQLTYTFHIREDAKWSNGDPVTANDFEFAWKRALDPKLASPYAYQLYYIAGAEDYNGGKNTDPNSVQVKATDATTLKVTLKQPTPYFASLTSFFTYYPLDERMIKGKDDWAAEAATMYTDGAFKLAEWRHNDEIILRKNEQYYDAEDVKLQEVDMFMISDASTEMNMFRTGQIDWNGSPNGAVPPDLIPSLKKQGKLHISGSSCTVFYQYNLTAKPFDNLKIRQALAMAIDRRSIVDNVTQANQLPAYGFVAPGIAGPDGKSFRGAYKDDYFKEDIDQAKKLLADGLSEEGLSAFPNVTLLFNTSDVNKKIAQAIADMWKTNLGVEVHLENQEGGVFLNNVQHLNYQIARLEWCADYNDPMSFIDLFASTGGNNGTGFKNTDYDKLVKDAQATSDNKKRMDMMVQAEQILIKDNQVINPLYYSTNVWQQNEKVKGILIYFAGNMDFTRGYITK